MTPTGAALAQILDSVPQPIWVVDPNGYILYTNAAAVAALGYDDADELRGRPSHETLHPYRPDGSPFPAAECPMLTPSATGEPVHGDDEWFLLRDGTFIPASWWATPVDLPIGTGVIYSFFDTTEKRELERATRDRDTARIRAAESRAAQRRIVESVAAVHRRTTRDLQAGAQQRLANLMIGLRLARESMPDTTSPALELIDQSIAEAQAAIDELRELAAGIHPSVLTVRGLSAAVRTLALRCPIPTLVDGSCERLPTAVESNAYFIVAEALTNAVKHSKATQITISLTLDHALRITVTDDGIGGIPTHSPGNGLTGLADRVAAFDGTLTITSPAGQGTTVHAQIPIRT